MTNQHRLTPPEPRTPRTPLSTQGGRGLPTSPPIGRADPRPVVISLPAERTAHGLPVDTSSGGARLGDTQPIPAVTLTHHTAEMPLAEDDPEDDPVSWHYSTYRPPTPPPDDGYHELGPWWTRIIAILTIAAPTMFGIGIGWSELT